MIHFWRCFIQNLNKGKNQIKISAHCIKMSTSSKSKPAVCSTSYTWWLTFCFNNNCLAFFYKVVCEGSGLGFAGVVAVFRRLRHSHVSVWRRDFFVMFVDGELDAFVADLLGNINGDRAGQLEVVSLKNVDGLHCQPWLWKQLCWRGRVKKALYLNVLRSW